MVAYLRQKTPFVARWIDNQPVLLMMGDQFCEDNMRRAHVTKDDIRAKLREANVLDYSQVRAVVFETTGDISVLHTSQSEQRLSLDLLADVRQSSEVNHSAREARS